MTHASAFDPDLFGRGEDHTVGRFLASRGARSHLVCARVVRDALPPDPIGAFTWSESIDDVPATARALYVDSPLDERRLLKDARLRFPDARVMGVRHHLAPMLASDRQPLKHVPVEFRPASLQRYVIACPARSGSTLLGELLTQAGIGRPKEHLRTLLAAALRSPGVDRAEIWRQVAWRAKAGNVFGSKLVAEFLLAAAGPRGVGELLDDLAPDDVHVIALRRPVLETVVSRYVARAAEQWTVRGDMSAEERARFSAPDYLFEDMEALLKRALAENRAMDDALLRLPAQRVMRVDYAELGAKPIRTLERIAEFVGVPPALGGVKLDKLPVKISSRVDTHARLGERFAADLRERGRPLEALLIA